MDKNNTKKYEIKLNNGKKFKIEIEAIGDKSFEDFLIEETKERIIPKINSDE